jgi:hypothetical protein
MPTPDLKVNYQVVDKRLVTIPNVALDTIATENLGQLIVHAGQDGYMLKSMKTITEERGHQMDPYTVLKGVELTFEKS